MARPPWIVRCWTCVCGEPYLVLLLRKLKHMQSRTHSSPRHTPTMMPVTAWTSSSVRPQHRMNNITQQNM